MQQNWNQELAQSYSQVSDLARAGLISTAEAAQLADLGDQFKIRITPYYAKLIDNSPDCPIRKQSIPHLHESDPALPDWASRLSSQIYGRPTPWHPDAIGDIQKLAAPRLTHRYRNRAILHLSSICAMYCRFCFRKSHLNDSDRTLYEGPLDPAFAYLERTPEIRELILTGGDPLSLTDPVIQRVFERVAKIPHVRTVRIHSRMAVTLPSRFTEALLDILGRDWNFNVILISHFNHPKELTHEALSALKNLRRCGVTLLNQSVLLKGINASVECLATLFQNLYEAGVLPYYLHHPDWTPGTFHFRPSIEEGRDLHAQLRGRLPGPALPDYILDIPQGFGKVSLLDSQVKKLENLPYDLTHRMSGAIYEVTAPATRDETQGNAKHRYLELFKIDECGLLS
jgi:lysine 2,3-aminomutase